jgi:LTXXQ motif family protein
MGPGMMGYGNMGPGMMGRNGMAGYGMMGWGGRGASMCTMMTAHIDGRLAYLKAELKITDAQESLWDAYAKAARDNAQTMEARCATMMSQGGPNKLALPDRLDLHEQFMAAQLESLRAMNKTLKPLYAALSDKQKQVADHVVDCALSGWRSMDRMDVVDAVSRYPIDSGSGPRRRGLGCPRKIHLERRRSWRPLSWALPRS